ISFWQPMASIVTSAPVTSSRSNRRGIAVISLVVTLLAFRPFLLAVPAFRALSVVFPPIDRIAKNLLPRPHTFREARHHRRRPRAVPRRVLGHLLAQRPRRPAEVVVKHAQPGHRYMEH